MERLTDKHWRNFDPWECCGQDHYCQRGCHQEGGCNNGCIVPKLYVRLAGYEDRMEKGLMPILPCKMGDLLWGIRRLGATSWKVQQAPVTVMRFLDDMTLSITLGKVCSGEFGKTIFLTREEAEAELFRRKLAQIPEEEPDEIDKVMIAQAEKEAAEDGDV